MVTVRGGFTTVGRLFRCECMYASLCVCLRQDLQQPRLPSLQVCGGLINMDGALSLLDSGTSHFMTINDFNELG